MLFDFLPPFLTEQPKSTLPGKGSCQMVDYQVFEDREVVCSGV